MPETWAMLCETVQVVGHGGDHIPAYLARPLDGAPRAGVLVIHYAPGWDETIKETCRRIVVVPPEELVERQPHPVFEMLSTLTAPGLRLFGGDDTEPSPAQVAQIDQDLTRLGKPHEFT